MYDFLCLFEFNFIVIVRKKEINWPDIGIEYTINNNNRYYELIIVHKNNTLLFNIFNIILLNNSWQPATQTTSPNWPVKVVKLPINHWA